MTSDCWLMTSQSFQSSYSFLNQGNWMKVVFWEFANWDVVSSVSSVRRQLNTCQVTPSRDKLEALSPKRCSHCYCARRDGHWQPCKNYCVCVAVLESCDGAWASCVLAPFSRCYQQSHARGRGEREGHTFWCHCQLCQFNQTLVLTMVCTFFVRFSFWQLIFQLKFSCHSTWGCPRSMTFFHCDDADVSN